MERSVTAFKNGPECPTLWKASYRLATSWMRRHFQMMTCWMQVFLAARYAKYVAPSNPKKSAKYYCWARAQVLFQA